MEDVLTEFERWQITAGVHPAVVWTRTNVILTLILEILLQIAGKSTERLKIYAHRFSHRILTLKTCIHMPYYARMHSSHASLMRTL